MSILKQLQVRKALATLPKTLNDTYTRLLCKLDEGHYQYAFKMLQWLTYSARPLKLSEIAEVIAIDVEGNPRFDPDNRFPEPRDILTICSSPVSLDENTLKDAHGERHTVVVRLAHLSVKEYLSSNTILQGGERCPHPMVLEMLAEDKHITVEGCIDEKNIRTQFHEREVG